MPITGLKLTGKWGNLVRALEHKTMGARGRDMILRATMANGKEAERRIRAGIKRDGFAKNADLTQAIKRSSKPLSDKGEMAKAITSQAVDLHRVFVGILRRDENYNVAVAVHEGVTIPVTEKMRNMFHWLWIASNVKRGRDAQGRFTAAEIPPLWGRAAELFKRMPKGWRRLSDETTAIILPSRPFIVKAIEDPAFRQFCIANWRKAYAAALRRATL